MPFAEGTQVSRDNNAFTVRVPLNLRRRGGRKLVITPTGSPQWQPSPQRFDNALVLALANAFRWQRMLDAGHYATVGDLAAAEKLDRSFVSRMLRLNLLAPDIVEAILDGRHSAETQRQKLLHDMPVEWAAQRATFG